MYKKFIKYGLSAVLYYSGLLELIRRVRLKRPTQGRLLVLMYHRVEDNVQGYDFAPSVTCAKMEQHMSYLRQKYKIISLDELSEYVHSRTLPSGDCLAVTFDDGYRDNYLNAYPILKRYNIPATIFLTSGFIGKSELFWWDRVSRILMAMTEKDAKLELADDIYPPTLTKILEDLSRVKGKNSRKRQRLVEELKRIYEDKKLQILVDLEKNISTCLPEMPAPPQNLNWDEVREMSKNGMTFGSHTVTHPIMTRINTKTAKWQVVQSKKRIEAQLGREVLHFAYPNGQPEDFNAEIRKIIRDEGYKSACSTIDGSNGIADSPYVLKRKCIDDYPLYVFAFELSPVRNIFNLLKKHWPLRGSGPN